MNFSFLKLQKMTGEKIKERFNEVSELIQTEFNRNIEKYGEKIKCRKGCSQCCSQIFRITLIDGFIISEHVNSLDAERKSELKEKSISYLKNVKSFESDDSLSHFREPKLPCPALGKEGECTIYEARPVICRRFGPPVYDYKNPGNLFACELNFKDGQEIIDEELIPLQTKIGIKWDKLKTDFNKSAVYKKNASTTIAEAILNSGK